MSNERGNGGWGLIIVIALIWGAVSLFSSDDGQSSSSYYDGGYESSYSYDDYYEPVDEPENPYSDGSGHAAGYEWAQENEVDSCGGKSQSFIEGCEEYLNQQDAYESYEDEAEDYYENEYYR